MNIDKIVEVNIQISEAMSIDGGYDTILIVGPLPKAPGGRVTPDVAGYASLQDLKSAGFAADDPVYIGASKVFGQSPKPPAVMIAVQKLSSGSTEKVDVTLDRAIGMPGWYCICPAGIKEDFYQSILADDCTTNTVIHYHAIIRKALQTAVKKDILLKNPADKVDRPKKNVFHGSFYSEEEMLTLFDAVSGDPLELCVKIAAYYGLRRSEVLGLRWSAIDMEHKTISISHKVIEAEVDGKFVPMGEDVLKTKSSFRTLPLIPAVGIILLEEKEKQEMYRRLFKKSYCRDYLDYICVDQCGKLLRPNYVTEHFSWLIEKYGLRKVRFHDLRHTCASLLLSNGISMKQIQIWLGHSTFSTTADIYAHLDYSAQEASANAMNGMFNRPEKEEQLA